MEDLRQITYTLSLNPNLFNYRIGHNIICFTELLKGGVNEYVSALHTGSHI